MGIVVDRAEAEATPCRCFKIDPDGPETPKNLMCFSKGVVGTLTNRQDEELCPERNIQPTSSALTKRMQIFKQLGQILDICLESEVEDPFRCIAQEAEKKAGTIPESLSSNRRSISAMEQASILQNKEQTLK